MRAQCWEETKATEPQETMLAWLPCKVDWYCDPCESVFFHEDMCFLTYAIFEECSEPWICQTRYVDCCCRDEVMPALELGRFDDIDLRDHIPRCKCTTAVPEKDQHKYNGCEEMGSLEELIAKVAIEVISNVLKEVFLRIAYRIGLHDMKVSQAWKSRATTPVQYSKILLTVN